MIEETLKLQELEEVLDRLQNTKQNESEIIKLKRLLLSFNKKYEKMSHDFSKKEDLTHIADAQELQKENESLIKQQKKLKDLAKKSQKETQDLKQMIAHTEQTLSLSQERNRQLENEWEMAQKKLKELEQSLQKNRQNLQQPPAAPSTTTDAAIHEEQLERALRYVANQSEERQLELQALQKDFNLTYQCLEANGEHNTLIFELQKQRDKALQDLEAARESLAIGLRETKEIKYFTQQALHEKAAALQKNLQMQANLQELRALVQQKDKELDMIRSQMTTIKAEQLIHERHLEKEKDQYRFFEKNNKEKEEVVGALKEQIRALQSRVKATEESLLEKSNNVIEAQQHLAKKMKEYALLTERIDQQHQETSRVEEQLHNAHAKIKDAQNHIDTLNTQVKKLEEEISLLRGLYTDTNEKLQEAEIDNEELRKIEAKYEQLHVLLNNLGSVMAAPADNNPMKVQTTPLNVESSPGSNPPSPSGPSPYLPPPTPKLGPRVRLGDKKSQTDTYEKNKKNDTFAEKKEPSTLFDLKPNDPRIKNDLFE